jgi:hypothetical protein
MDNVGDFVRRATNERIYVLPVLDAYPQNDLYFTIAAKAAVGTDRNVAGENLWYLNPGYVAAKAEYMRRFASELKARIGAAGMPTILAYSAQNEVFFEGNKAPYNSWSGTVTSLNGVRYDMADAAQRQESADASLVEYTKRLRRELVQADPTAMLTMGFFTNNAVGKASFTGFRQPSTTRDFRFPGRPEAASRSGALDFLDMHVYPSGSGYRLVDDLRSSEARQIRKPYVLGEFGAIRTVYGNDVRRAAFAMRDLQIALEACQEHAVGEVGPLRSAPRKSAAMTSAVRRSAPARGLDEW